MTSEEIIPKSVHEYVEDYEFRFEGGGGHTPSESDKVMLEDAIEGYLSMVNDARLESLMEIRRIANEPGDRRMLVDKIYGVALAACRASPISNGHQGGEA